MQSLVDGGTDIIELGVPFQIPWPMALPSKGRANDLLLQEPIYLKTLCWCGHLERGMLAPPVILMGYMNPFERLGFERFAKEARASGADGVLVVDLPPEESVPQNKILTLNGIRQIFLVAPIPQRIE